MGAAALWTVMACCPAQAQNYFAPESLLSSSLDQTHIRRYVEWDVNGGLGAVVNVSASAGSSLSQAHGVRVTVCRPDRSVVACKHVMVGETKTLNFNLSTGRYFVFFDLGVADAGEAIGQVNFTSTAQLTDLSTGEAVHVDGDDPPDPLHPPKSDIILPGGTELDGSDMSPILNGPPQTCLVFLHD